MGDLNQLDWVLEERKRVRSPILEVGSKNHGNTNNFRPAFPEATYLGVDLEEGDGVDLVCDLAAPFEEVDRRLQGRRFRTGICLSVLEHCHQPFLLAENLTRILEAGASLFVSVPWVWNLHGYPDDYWRISPAGIALLFPRFEVVEESSFWSTKNRGERIPLSQRKHNVKEPAFFKTPELARELREKGLTSFLHPYYCYPIMVNMLLVRRP